MSSVMEDDREWWKRKAGSRFFALARAIWQRLSTGSRQRKYHEREVVVDPCRTVEEADQERSQNHVLRRSYVRRCGLRTIAVVLVRSGLCRNVFHYLVYAGVA